MSRILCDMDVAALLRAWNIINECQTATINHPPCVSDFLRRVKDRLEERISGEILAEPVAKRREYKWPYREDVDAKLDRTNLSS